MATATEPTKQDESKSAETSTKKTSTKKVKALLLTLGGAPESWHVIHGVGHVHPTIPSPVGGEREPSLEAAKKLADAPGCAVKLVTVTAAQATKGRKARAVARGEGLAEARELRKKGTKKLTGAEASQLETEVASAAGKE